MAREDCKYYKHPTYNFYDSTWQIRCHFYGHRWTKMRRVTDAYCGSICNKYLCNIVEWNNKSNV